MLLKLVASKVFDQVTLNALLDTSKYLRPSMEGGRKEGGDEKGERKGKLLMTRIRRERERSVVMRSEYVLLVRYKAEQ